MSLYELLKFIHILAAITWVGTSIEQQFVGIRAQRSGEPERYARFIDEAEWLGLRVMTPAALVVVIAGVSMVIESGWNFSDLWIMIGIGLFTLTALNGMLFLTPLSKQIKGLMSERGLEDPVVREKAQRLAVFATIDLIILIAVVWDMVVKPGV